MATTLPFTPTTGPTTGTTVKVTANSTPTSVSGSLDCTAKPANNILVVNTGTVLVFVRMSGEATPAATAADIPLAAGAARVFMNPVTNGKAGLAVLSSTTTACDVYFTPCEGGT